MFDCAKTGWVYLPTHLLGYMVTLLAILFMIPVLMGVYKNAPAVSDALNQLFVNITFITFWWNQVAEKTVEL